ncbi:Aste57867_13575 [Aphanomyces stellatus]|uniref:Aste57867_13575 protein n=1 Tax=Aphanomyces stellatus TaxID=120398 RepID=A0A485KZ06_9STRA|nr:hypothetical protein As57867_013525 [Aphanomyces stellatus]VFT90413.1 Aste57867_13575 [Aphanomyces stellatus]
MLFQTLAVGLAALPAVVHGWWDMGHMFIGEIATQSMAAADVATVHALLVAQDDEFPNTHSITTTAIWPDLLKCNSVVSTYCPSPLQPALNIFDMFHFIALPVNASGGGAYKNLTSADVDKLLAEKLDGGADTFFTKALGTFNSTQSVYAAIFVTRFYIHAFGDVHQPLHAAAGVSPTFPQGDNGGNSVYLDAPCAAPSLHGLWDGGFAHYDKINWSPAFAPDTPSYASLVANATALLGKYADEVDPLAFDALLDVDYNTFVKAMANNGPASLLKQVFMRSYDNAHDAVYGGLNTTCTMKNGKCFVPCPSVAYSARGVETVERSFVLAGRRLAVILTQFARQIRALKLVHGTSY